MRASDPGSTLDRLERIDVPRDPLPPLTSAFIVGFFVYELAYLLGAFSTRAFFILPESHRAISLGLIIFLTLLLKRIDGRTGGRVPWYDYLIMVAGAAGCFYIAPTDRIVHLQMASPVVPPLELALGTMTILVLLEGTRRVSGWALPAILVVFIGYAVFADRFPVPFYGRAHSLSRVIGEIYLSLDGVFGRVMGLWTRVLVVFMLFGGFLQVSGAGRFFVRLALALTGHLRGGPAKVATVASGLFGTISGSAAADVAATGVITIPMMKAMGYRPAFAGAVEAVASTGGVVMPPVMGMVAFMMAEFLDVPYLEVALAAAIPAALYYFSLYMLVDLEARRNDLGGLPASSLPSVWETLRGGWFYVIPIAVLVYTLAFSRMPAGIAAAYGLGALLIVSSFNPETRFTFPRLLHGFQASARNSVVIAVICGSVGILVASVVITGATLRMGVLLVEAAGDRLFPLLLMAGVGSLVLGTGVPSIASYTLLAVTVAPAVIELGVPAIGAHLFVVYWGVSHVFTPPVGGALYIASSFSGVDIWRQGFHAVRLGIAIFVVPFLFCYHPELLLIGTPEAILLQTLIAALAMVCVTSSFIGYIRTPLGWTTRVWLVAAAVALAVQGPVLLPAGLLLALAVMASQLVAARAAAPHDRETTWPDRPAGPEEAPLTGDRRGSPRREP